MMIIIVVVVVVVMVVVVVVVVMAAVAEVAGADDGVREMLRDCVAVGGLCQQHAQVMSVGLLWRYIGYPLFPLLVTLCTTLHCLH